MLVNLAAYNAENKVAIARAGAIEPLVGLVRLSRPLPRDRRNRLAAATTHVYFQRFRKGNADFEQKS